MKIIHSYDESNSKTVFINKITSLDEPFFFFFLLQIKAQNIVSKAVLYLIVYSSTFYTLQWPQKFLNSFKQGNKLP